MTEYLLYPGCVASVRELGYEMSMRAVFKALGASLKGRDDFNCCMPACLVHSVDYSKGLALTARNLAIAEEEEELVGLIVDEKHSEGIQKRST